MSGAFPISNSKFSTMGIKSIQNTIISKSDSGKKLARQIDGQRFGFTAEIITGKRSDVYGELMAFIIKQRSGKENFTITPPEIKNARGSETGTVYFVNYLKLHHLIVQIYLLLVVLHQVFLLPYRVQFFELL